MAKNLKGRRGKMKINQKIVLILLFCILGINLGCGKKAPPRPPEEILNLGALSN
jgi:hypothetical protein